MNKSMSSCDSKKNNIADHSSTPPAKIDNSRLEQEAIEIVKDWDPTRGYPWNDLWGRLNELGWRYFDDKLYGKVIVPVWTINKYEYRSMLQYLSKNKDFFLDKSDVKSYIEKYGVKETSSDSPINEKRPKRVPQMYGSSCVYHTSNSFTVKGKESKNTINSDIFNNFDLLCDANIYIWSHLWEILEKYGWSLLDTKNYYNASQVYVPVWAIDKFENVKRCPASLKIGLDFFIEKEEIFNFLQKDGLDSIELHNKEEMKKEIYALLTQKENLKTGKNRKSESMSENFIADHSSTPDNDRDAAAHIIKQWDSYSKQCYPWGLL